MDDIAKTPTPVPTSDSALLRALKSFALLRESWVGMIGAGTVIHLVTIADSRHRLGLEVLFLAMAGCRMLPFTARRLVLAASLLALLVLLSATAGVNAVAAPG